MAKGTPKTGNVAQKVENLVRPVVEGMGLRLWDVRFEKEGTLWVLKILIDRDGPMDTDTCEAVSRAVDPLLDEADPIEQSYCLEVGSPGLGRKLTRPEHFDWLAGQKVTARLYQPDAQGRKEVAGLLLGVQDGTARLQADDELIELPLKAAGSFRLCDDEDLFG